jgi:ABC-type multidrug transport system fused ATPase/permease subunit
MKEIIRKYFKYFSFFFHYLRYRFFLMLLLSVGVGFLDGIGLALFMPLLQVVGSSEASNSETMGNMAFVLDGLQNLGLSLTLTVVLMVMLVVYVIKGGFKFLESYYKVVLRMLFIRKLRYRMIDGMANLRYQAFVNSDAGKIQNSLSGEAGQVVQAFVAYTSTLQALLILLVYLTMAFLANPQFSLFVIIGGILTNLIYQSIYKLTKKLSRDIVRVGHRFQGLLIQSVHYYKYLKATGAIKGYARRLKVLVNQIEGIQKRMGVLNSILTATREPLVMLVVIVVILIQVKWMGANLASIILSLLFFYRSLNSLMIVQTSWNGFLNKSGSIENAKDFMNELEVDREQPKTEKIDTIGSGITLRKVSFYYMDNVPVLENINLEIKPNETIAFVGESGSGKTTLMNMIAGLLDGYSGVIEVNAKNYQTLNMRSLQNRIGYITQEPVVFSDTLYNNVTFWAPKTVENMARFKTVMEKTTLYDFVKSLPKKEDSELGDNGIQISGGQKQRISIARELYKNVDLLLLDEATSALDSQTERVIQENIDALKGQYTMIIVAHRLSTVRNADRIVVLDKGQINGIGKFDELVQSNERFSKMVQLQEF